ncbi:ASKHA domain-containing protein [Acidobacteriota bacterium]
MPSQKKKTFTIRFLPFDIFLDVTEGTTILEAAVQGGLPLKSTCGGAGTCGDCVVKISEGNYSKNLSAGLPDRLNNQGYSLSCKTSIGGDLEVILPQFQRQSIRAEFSSGYCPENEEDLSADCGHSPLLKKLHLKVPPPTLEDNYSDLKRLELAFIKATGIPRINCTYPVIEKLAALIRKNKSIGVLYYSFPDAAQIIDVLPADSVEPFYGLACDIGTSTVAVHLVDLRDGRIAGTAASLNQQIKCGEDVISRINFSQKKNGLDELQHLIRLTLNGLIEKICTETGVTPTDIYYAVISGNTTMIHLLLHLNPQFIREEPYVPTFNSLPLLGPERIGIDINTEAKLYFSPSVGSYVGGDITAGLLCTPINRSPEKISMFMDIGTNGELVIGNSEWMMTCACSAGPAFEGSGIRCGTYASEGAIEKIWLREDMTLQYNVIGGTRPKGLCGSGLIDLIAELFTYGLIDRSGKFTDKAEPKIVDSEEGPAYLLVSGTESHWGTDLVITENDIANIVRTKAAVYSASSLLLKNAGLKYDRIDEFYISGGFGRHLNIENAVRIGLLPDIDRTKFRYLGNSSLYGSYLILHSEINREMVQEIADKMTYIELNTEPAYMNELTGAMFLPHTDITLFPSVNCSKSHRGG